MGTQNRWSRCLIETVVAGLVVVVVTQLGCTITDEAECSGDEDCASDQYCLEGGGVLVRDGLCVDRDAGVSDDVIGDECPDGEIDCGGDCVDVDTDLEHCGQCDRRCSTEVSGADPVCEDGRCGPVCVVSEQTLCLDFALCTDLAFDDHHCGECGDQCLGTETCEDGVCVCDEPCCDDADCPFDMVCQSNECRCIGDSNCADGDRCHPTDDICVDCVDDGDCPEHEFCHDSDCQPLVPYLYTASSDGTVRKIDSAGDQIWSYDGHTAAVNDVVVDPDGYVYSASADTTVHKISSDGDVQWTFDEHEQTVQNIDVDTDGYVYSASTDASIRKISPDGDGEWSFDELSVWFSTVEVGPDGRIYAGDTLGSLHRITTDGNDFWSFDASGAIFSIGAYSEEFLYLGQSQMVQQVDTDGVNTWDFDVSSTVQDIAVDAEGTAFVAAGDDSLRSIDPDTGESWQLDDEDNARSVAVDPEGDSYFGVINSGADFVRKFDGDGQLLWSFQGHSDTVNAVAVDPGRYGVFSDDW